MRPPPVMLRAMLGKSPLAFSVPDFLHRVLVGGSPHLRPCSGEKPGLAGVVWVVCPPPLILTGAHSSPGYGRNLPNQPFCGTGLSSAFLTTIWRPMVSRVFNEVRAWEQVHDWRHSTGVSCVASVLPHLLSPVSYLSSVSSVLHPVLSCKKSTEETCNGRLPTRDTSS